MDMSYILIFLRKMIFDVIIMKKGEILFFLD